MVLRRGRGGGRAAVANRRAGVEVLGWEQVGNYAIRFDSSDGHRTGLFTYPLLQRLGALPRE